MVLSREAYRTILSLPAGSLADDPRLTARQREILALVQKGLTNREISGIIGLRERAVKAEIGTMLLHFEVANRTELAFGCAA